MRRVVLLGSPVAHSLSPAIQGAAFEATGLDWRYQAVEVDGRALPDAIRRMRAEGWAGANVTIPLKETVLPLLDDLDPSASETRAVNTIVARGSTLVGHNTDLPGFLRDLQANWPVPVGGAAMILGAGGAARAVAFGLARLGLDLRLISRSAGRGEALGHAVRRVQPVDVQTLPWRRGSFERAADGSVLIVNATPLGMLSLEEYSPWPDGLPLPPGACVYDLVYTPRATRFVRQARLAGLHAISGAGMLVEQGALAFELWTGREAPRDRMRAAMEGALGSAVEVSPASNLLPGRPESHGASHA
jgi:shikimate dehydrogenase